MADSPGKATIRIDLDVQFDSVEALTSAALARTQTYEYSSDEEAESERELVSSDLGVALMELLDVDAVVGATTPVEITGWTCGAESVTLQDEDENASEPSTEHPPVPETERPEFTEASIARDGVHIHGIDWVFEPDPGDAPADQARMMREASIVKGLLWHASQSVIDELFQDLDTLKDRAGDAAAWEDTNIIGLLPPRFAEHYGTGFARMFLVATVDVTARLAHGWEHPATVAHELATQILIAQAAALQELLEIRLEFDWREDLEEALFQDRDFELLYEPSMDGIESYAPPELGMTPMDFNSWFTPFADGHPSPFATNP